MRYSSPIFLHIPSLYDLGTREYIFFNVGPGIRDFVFSAQAEHALKFTKRMLSMRLKY
jgi:hypothetical protein